MRDIALLIRDIIPSIERIERYSARGREAFEQDELIQTCWLAGVAGAKFGRMMPGKPRVGDGFYQ